MVTWLSYKKIIRDRTGSERYNTSEISLESSTRLFTLECALKVALAGFYLGQKVQYE